MIQIAPLPFVCLLTIIGCFGWFLGYLSGRGIERQSR
jgi:hypothetical protein